MSVFINENFSPHSVVTVSFEGDEMIQFIGENVSPKQVCVVLSHTDLEREIVVTVSTEEGTASGMFLQLL